MKLRNKKTGESYETTMPIVFNIKTNGGGEHTVSCESITALNDAWEDAPEEPKQWYGLNAIRDAGFEPLEYEGFEDVCKRAKELGIGFESKEEAEAAVDRLKAWKRLRDKGFEFDGWKRDERYYGDFTITATDQISCDDKDLELLFGGEE